MKLSLIAMSALLLACGSDPDPKTETPVVVVSTTIPAPRPIPAPVHVKECTVTKITNVYRECQLYDLMCDDGEPDMVLLCPIDYWDRGKYIPTPP